MLLRLFSAALWSPVGKGRTTWLLLVMFIVFLLRSHVVSWCQVSYLIVSFPDLCRLTYFAIGLIYWGHKIIDLCKRLGIKIHPALFYWII